MAISGFGEIVEQLRRSTVLIQADNRGNGSGVIWTSDGIIVTNAHVARNSALSVRLWDGRELPAETMSRDPRRDLALLHINGKDLPAADFQKELDRINLAFRRLNDAKHPGSRRNPAAGPRPA